MQCHTEVCLLVLTDLDLVLFTHRTFTHMQLTNKPCHKKLTPSPCRLYDWSQGNNGRKVTTHKVLTAQQWMCKHAIQIHHKVSLYLNKLGFIKTRSCLKFKMSLVSSQCACLEYTNINLSMKNMSNMVVKYPAFLGSVYDLRY